MNKVNLGGRMVAPIGIGTWHMGDDAYRINDEIESIREGLSLGANVIDTAEMYGAGRSEKLVGKAIKGKNREELYIISKFYPQNAAEPNLSLSLDASLSRLDTEYLDMYLLHWRGNIPLERTVYDLENLVVKGKIRTWGVSNFDTLDLLELMEVTDGKNCAANENLYNIASRGIEYDLLPLQKKLGMPLVAYAPTDQGDSRGAGILSNKTLLELAELRGCSIYQLILAWAIRDGRTVAIPQTSNPKHMIQNIQASRFDLTTEELGIIDSVCPPPKRKIGLDII